VAHIDLVCLALLSDYGEQVVPIWWRPPVFERIGRPDMYSLAMAYVSNYFALATALRDERLVLAISSVCVWLDVGPSLAWLPST
jgi:hypothetical protein